MGIHERVERAVYEAIDELNRQLPKGVEVEKSPDAPLYGKSGKLESLDFVTFIMEVESKVGEEFGVEIVLTDEQLLSRQNSPFLTVRSLTEHLEQMLAEQAEGNR